MYYDTKSDINNISNPFSHAFIVKEYLEELKPEIVNYYFTDKIINIKEPPKKANQLSLDL